jgi:hypothetical protein
MRRSALPDQTVQQLDHVLAAQAMAYLDRQSFTAKHIDHGQRPELLAVAQLVMNKIQAPHFV